MGNPVIITDENGQKHRAVYVRTGKDGRHRGFAGTDLVYGTAEKSDHEPDPQVLEWMSNFVNFPRRKGR
jgi:hypothetical protein